MNIRNKGLSEEQPGVRRRKRDAARMTAEEQLKGRRKEAGCERKKEEQ